MSATDRKINTVIAESLGVSTGSVLQGLLAKLIAHETERSGHLQGVTFHRGGMVRATYVYDVIEFANTAELAAWLGGRS